MAALVSATNPQQSVQSRIKTMREPHEQRALQLLLAAMQVDLANVMAQHNVVCARLDALSIAATAAGAVAPVGTAIATAIPANNVSSLGADVAAATLLTTICTQP